MSGIDRLDQMSAYYSFERKTPRWYKEIDLHLIHLLLINSFLYITNMLKRCHCMTTGIQGLLNNQNIQINTKKKLQNLFTEKQ